MKLPHAWFVLPIDASRDRATSETWPCFFDARRRQRAAVRAHAMDAALRFLCAPASCEFDTFSDEGGHAAGGDGDAWLVEEKALMLSPTQRRCAAVVLGAAALAAVAAALRRRRA